MNKRAAFTLIEILIAMSLLIVVGLIGYYLLFWGIQATTSGAIAAQIQQDAKTALSTMTNELRQAVPVPNPDGSGNLSSAVILPGPGEYVSNYTITDTTGSEEFNQSSEIGFSIGCGGGNLNPAQCGTNASGSGSCPLNPKILVSSPSMVQNQDGQTGFLIFSELISNQGDSSPSYLNNPANYEWVMYQINPPENNQPAELLRYTFPAATCSASCTLNGLNSTSTGWTINWKYFVSGNSNESAAGNINPVIAALTNPSDDLWIMVSHQPTPENLPPGNQGGLTNMTVYSPNVFTITVAAGGATVPHNPNAPLAVTTLSSIVQTQGIGSTP
jgi:type II secretory pathway pseudopilin PulG